MQGCFWEMTGHIIFAAVHLDSSARICLRSLKFTKGQLISKANCYAVNSSKKQTNEFISTTMRHVFVRILEELNSTKRHFEIK